MSNIDTQTLDLILSEISALKKKLDIFVPNLTIEKEVIHFLQKDKRTFRKYLDENYLEEGIHYFNDCDKRVYIPDAIVAFKKSGCRPPVTSSKSQAVLKKLGL